MKAARWLGLCLIACGHTVHQGEATPDPGQGGTTSPSPSAGADAGGKPSGGGGAGGSGAGGSGGEIFIDPVPEAGRGGEPPAPTPHAAIPCENPMPLPNGGGFEVCEDTTLRRQEAAACPSALPRPEPASGAAYDECVYDADCTENTNGYCVIGACYYGCTTDAECGSGGICFCGPVIGTCLAAGCRSDADCPADYPCTGNPLTGAGQPDFACQTPTDTCQKDADCNSASPRVHCVSNGTRRTCVIDMAG